VRIFNHAPRRETYRLGWNMPTDWRLIEADKEVVIPARKEAAGRAVFTAGGPSLHIVTADVAFADKQLREWVEALVRVSPSAKP
jgi:hypothetical protein